MRTDNSGQRAPRQPAVRMQTGAHQAVNLKPLLHEIRCALVTLSTLDETTVVDLRKYFTVVPFDTRVCLMAMDITRIGNIPLEEYGWKHTRG